MRISDWRIFFFPTTFPLCKCQQTNNGNRPSFAGFVFASCRYSARGAQLDSGCGLSKQIQLAMFVSAFSRHRYVLFFLAQQIKPLDQRQWIMQDRYQIKPQIWLLSRSMRAHSAWPPVLNDTVPSPNR